MKLFRETLGIVEAEIFIANTKTQGFDYTEWRKNLWEDITLKELLERAVQAEEKYGVPKGIEIF